MANISQIKLPDNTVYDIKDAGALRTITSSNVTTALGYTPLNSALKGTNNGVAELDANGKVPSSQLPSYVDDVLEYAKLSSFPTTGETGKIYIAQDTNKTYRWSGTAYVEISASLALGTTSSTAYRGDYGNAAYTHAVTNKGAAFTSGLYKITTNSEGHVTAATAVAKSDITALGIPGSDTNTHRPVQVNGTQALASNTTALNLKAGSNVSITDGGSGAITIAATDTNTWRSISDSVSSTASDVSASSKAVKTAYDLAASKTANTGTVTSVATGVGLTGGTITGSGTLKAKLRSETALTIDSAAATTTSGRVYPVAVDKTGYLAVNVPWTDSKPVTSVAGKTGAVTLTNSDVGLGNVENKSSATIRSELTKANVTTALGYTPISQVSINGTAGGSPSASFYGIVEYKFWSTGSSPVDKFYPGSDSHIVKCGGQMLYVFLTGGTLGAESLKIKTHDEYSYEVIYNMLGQPIQTVFPAGTLLLITYTNNKYYLLNPATAF